MIQKKFFFLILMLFAVSSTAQATVANRVENAGFENGLGSASWDNTANRGISRVSGAGAPEGNTFLRLDETTTVGAGFAGVFTFQTITGVKQGDFVSYSGLIRVNALDVGKAAQLRIEFQNSSGTLIDGTNIAQVAAVNGAFARVRTSGRAPAGTAQVTFVIRIQPSTAGDGGGTSIADFDDIEGTINPFPVNVTAVASSEVARVGEMGALTLGIDNTSAETLAGVEVVVEPANGIRVLPDRGSLDGELLSSRQGSVIYNAGTLAPGQNSVFSAPYVLSSSIVPGKTYEILIHVRNITNGTLSPLIRVQLRAELDPIFDEGTIIGKVFHDANKNGIQDSGEHGYEMGIGGVRLVTEEGIEVLTDPHGKFHIPAVKPGRHVLKIDGHTLPQGTEFITEESYLLKTTPGILNKVNFAVFLPESKIPRKFQEDLSVTVTQGMDVSKPVLDVQAEPEIIRVAIDSLAQKPVFHFKTNYSDFIQNWFLEIRDELGEILWEGGGVGEPPTQVIWEGLNENGLLPKPGVYSYQLKVIDKDGNEDWTVLRFLRILSQKDSKAREQVLIEIPPVGDFNLFKDGKQSIPLIAKPTLHIQGITKKGNTVTINDYPAETDPDTGHFGTELYVSPGEKEIVVVSTDANGESISYRETVTVNDSTFFMVALAEEELGINFQDGDFQTVAEEDKYKAGFYEDGRLSFYLRGKLKGKFLVKAHYDTDDKRSGLFTNLDPDDYYPVYGDSSQINYEAHDTLDRFYFVVEMNRSFVKWGTFKTNFTDTELSTYNRTLNGLKVHYETVKTTPYGDAKGYVKGFISEARHRSDHNEFLATGGALYYLRNRSLIQGGEKVRVEIRDKIQEIPIHSYDLVEGIDYEIDYDEGRILLTKPLSSVAAADTIINNDILGGHPVYLIVDYEYDAGNNVLVNGNRGLRGSTHFGNHLRIGGTYIQERRRNDGGDYNLRGIDMTLKFGRNTKIYAEYAETRREQVDNAVSFNGGLSFANLEPIKGVHSRPRENAYLIKAESQPFKNLSVSGFLQAVEPNFSTERAPSQEGFKKYGVSARYDIGEYASVRYRFDHSSVVDQLFPLEDNNVFAPFDTYQAHTVQASYDDGQWLGDIEYRHQITDLPRANLAPTLLSEAPFRDGGAAKIGYRLNERLLPYAKMQFTGNGEGNYQLGGGLKYEITDQIVAYVEEMFGTAGDSTLFGFEHNKSPGTRSYANLRMVDRGIGSKALATTIGNSWSINSHSRMFTEREYSSFNGENGYADIMGYEAKISDKWSFGARFERRHLDNPSTRLLDVQAANALLRSNTTNTVSTTIAYDDRRRVKFRTYLEGRRDTDDTKLWQIVSRNSAEYKVNDDLTFVGNLNFGKSKFTDPSDNIADFLEFNTGFAYRPINYDKLNILGKYSYIRDKGNDLQFQSALFSGIEIDERSHVLSVDLAYDLHRYVGFVQKLAYKNSMLHTPVSGQSILHNILWASRINIHVTRKWDLALEYRMLWQHDIIETLKHGAVVEVDREIYDYTKIGVGYNFTDFDDDLTKSSNIDSHGPYVRMTGKF